MQDFRFVLKKIKRLIWPDQPPIGEVFRSIDALTFSNSYQPGMARFLGQSSPIFEAFSSAKKMSTKWTHYFDIYDECLVPLRDWLASTSTAPGVLEIGSAYGGSLIAWKSFFGDSSVVCGLDVAPKELNFHDPQIKIVVGSQTDETSLHAAVGTLPNLHLVIDDGSHVGRHQKRSFEFLWPKLAYGGLYIVEDLHTAFWKEYEGGIFRRRKSSFIDYAKRLVNIQHSHYSSRRRNRFERSYICDSIFSISFFDSIVVIRKEKMPDYRSKITNRAI